MTVLYLSKASRVVAHRDKLAELAKRVPLHTVVPRRWGATPMEPPDPRHPPVELIDARMHGRNHLHWYPGLAEVLDRVKPTLVHADEEPYSAVTFQVARLCARRGIPFVFFAWQNLVKRLPLPFGYLRRHVYRTAAGGIAGTPSAARVLTKTGWCGPTAVIPQMGVDPARFRPDADARALLRNRLGWPDDVPVVGFVGRLVPEKGVDLLLDAVARVEWIHAIVVGGGPEEDALRRRVSEAGTSDRVVFVGEVASGFVPGWMATFDALVLPSRTRRTWAEQFGRVLVEAMACEIPVVVSDSGEMRDVVGDGGLSVPEGNVGCLAETLAGLLDDSDARRRRGAAGRSRVLERFTQAAVADATASFYRSLPEGTP